MRSELFRIPIDLAGVPLFGLGVLLLGWVLVSAIAAWLVSRRPDGKAIILSYLPVFAIVAGMIYALPMMFPNGLPIRGYGLMLLCAASTGLFMATHRAAQHGIHSDVIYSLAFGMFLCGILGARLFFVIEYWNELFAPLGFAGAVRKALMFTEGGLVVYGSLIGASLAFVWRCWRDKLPMLAMGDLIAPSLAIGLAIGRIGCLLNGCCYGGPCERAWAVTFPNPSPPFNDQVSRGELNGIRLVEDTSDKNAEPVVRVGAVRLNDAPADLTVGAEVVAINGLLIDSFDQAAMRMFDAYLDKAPVTLQLESGKKVTLPAATPRGRSLPVHPTQIYSAVNAGLLGWFLWAWYPRRRRDGEVVALMLSIYPISRFLLEIIRTDESAIFGTGLSISQNVSIAILLAVVALWFFLLRREPKLSLQQS